MAVVACASRRSFRPRDQRCLSGWPTMTGMVRQVFSRGSAWADRHVCRERSALGDLSESGPEAYGLDSGFWTSPMIGRAVEAEFGVVFHPGHVRKLLAAIGFSVQCPRCRLARADATAQARWRRRPLPPLKNPKQKSGVSSLPRRPAFSKTRPSTRPGGGSAAGRKFR
jgi:transposase